MNASGVCEWEVEPSTGKFFREMIDFFVQPILNENPISPNEKVEVDWSNRIEFSEVLYVLGAAIVWLALGLFLRNRVFWNFVKDIDIPQKKKILFCEHAWYFLSTAIVVGFAVRYIFFKSQFFQCPSSTWDGWSLSEPVGSEWFPIVAITFGFYVNEMVSIMFFEERRNDTNSAIFHHVLTLFLSCVTYALRLHHIGMLTTFVMNATSIPLFFLLTLVQLKQWKHPNVKYVQHGMKAIVVLLLVSWVAFRLYWYPMKVLYTLGPIAKKKNISSKLPYLYLYAYGKSIFQALNIFWFVMLINTVYKVARSGSNNLNDIYCAEVKSKEN